jgi:hypothetical protein
MSPSSPRRRCRVPTRAALTVLAHALAAGTIGPGAIGAQVVIVDEGTFSVFHDSTRVGREDFSIRLTRGTGGGAYVAQGTLLAGERRTAVALHTDSAGGPARFQLEAREGSRLVESYSGELVRGIWSGRSIQANGESAREIRLQGARILIEPSIIHQLWFVVRAGAGSSVSLLVPRTLEELLVAVVELAPDRVQLGPREVPARRWEIRPAAGGAPLWELWTDTSGRLLRVRDLGAGVEAVRDEPPR